MKYTKDIKQGTPLRLLGKRVFISLGLLPYISMLRPMGLALATLKNPPGMVYTRKVFKYLKRVLLQRSFTQKLLKNQQKAKFLLRGFQSLSNQKTQSKSFPQLHKKITSKFNLNSLKTYFDMIQKHDNQQLHDRGKQTLTFLQSIPLTLQRRRQSDFNSCLRIKKVLGKLIRKEKAGNLDFCQKIYQNEFLKIRVPWTENIYSEIQVFGEQLWARYMNNEYTIVEKDVEKQHFQSQDYQSIEMEDKKSQSQQVIDPKPNTTEPKEQKEKINPVVTNNNDQFLKRMLTFQAQDFDNVDIYFSSFECDDK